MKQHAMALVAAAATPLLVHSGAMAQTIMDVGDSETTYQSWATAVSGDGLRVTGWIETVDGTRAFRWTAHSGLEYLDVPLGSYIWGMSDDGSTVVGETYSDANDRPFRFSSGYGLQYLPPGIGLAYGISGDGLTIVGRDLRFGTEAVRWSTSNGLQELGTLPGVPTSYATAVDYDGNVVVGACGSDEHDDYMRAFRWTALSGMQSLGVLPGCIGSLAQAISSDGSTIVGGSWPSPGGAYSHLTRWTEDSFEDLGVPQGFDAAIGLAVNSDGSVIVGEAAGFDEVGNPIVDGFIWSRDFGIRSLAAYLPSIGLDVSGWKLEDPWSISSDGMTIVGTGLHLGVERGWVLSLARSCGTADFNCDGDSGTDADIESFFACLGGRCPPPPCPGTADFDGDGDVGTDADIGAFFRVLAGGTC